MSKKAGGVNSNDHYVAEAHIKEFCYNDKKTLVYFCRKSAPDVGLRGISVDNACTKKYGDYNGYLKDPMILRKLLKFIEPKLPKAIKELQDVTHTTNSIMETIYLLAHYIAHLRALVPSAVRAIKTMVDSDLKDIKQILVKHGKITLPNDEPILDSEIIRAWNIAGLHKLAIGYIKSSWIILHNDTSKPFLFSDNPAIILQDTCGVFKDGQTYLPLTPTLAIIINPVKNFEEILDIDFGSMNKTQLLNLLKCERIQRGPINKISLEFLNNALVKNAEDKIISNVNEDWIVDMVKEFKDRKLDCEKFKVRSDQIGEIFKYNISPSKN